MQLPSSGLPSTGPEWGIQVGPRPWIGCRLMCLRDGDHRPRPRPARPGFEHFQPRSARPGTRQPPDEPPARSSAHHQEVWPERVAQIVTYGTIAASRRSRTPRGSWVTFAMGAHQGDAGRGDGGVSSRPYHDPEAKVCRGASKVRGVVAEDPAAGEVVTGTARHRGLKRQRWGARRGASSCEAPHRCHPDPCAGCR